MNYCDSIHDDVEALASQKPFGALTSEERDTVLRALGSADAYTSLRSIVVNVRSEFSADMPNLEPRASSRDSLRRMVEARSQQPRRILLADKCRAALNRRIPLSYSAAAVVAAIAMTLLLNHSAEQPVPVTKIVYKESPAAVQPMAQHAVVPDQSEQNTSDSVLQTVVNHVRKGMEAHLVGTVLRDTAREAVAVIVRSVSTSLPGSVRNEFVGLGNLQHLHAQPKGRTLAEDSSLSRFVRTFSDDTL